MSIKYYNNEMNYLYSVIYKITINKRFKMIYFNLMISILAIILAISLAGVSIYYSNHAFSSTEKTSKNTHVNQKFPKWKM